MSLSALLALWAMHAWWMESFRVPVMRFMSARVLPWLVGLNILVCVCRPDAFRGRLRSGRGLARV